MAEANKGRDKGGQGGTCASHAPLWAAQPPESWSDSRRIQFSTTFPRAPCPMAARFLALSPWLGGRCCSGEAGWSGSAVELLAPRHLPATAHRPPAARPQACRRSAGWPAVPPWQQHHTWRSQRKAGAQGRRLSALLPPHLWLPPPRHRRRLPMTSATCGLHWLKPSWLTKQTRCRWAQCSSRRLARSWRLRTTGQRRQATPPPMQNCCAFGRRQRRLAAGACWMPRCTSPWSPAPCAQEHCCR